MIINTGQRTDIPAFYAEWFANRLKAGSVCVRNPFDPQQVSRYRLDPEVVDVIGFCTKNPAPMLPYLDLLRDYGQIWHVTITPYGRDIEPNVPDKRVVMEAFKKLSARVGSRACVWRYDPILLLPGTPGPASAGGISGPASVGGTPGPASAGGTSSPASARGTPGPAAVGGISIPGESGYSVQYHIEAFAQMAAELEGYTDTVVISFIDMYQKVLRNFPEVRAVPMEQRREIAESVIRTAGEHGMTVRPCGEGTWMERYGADCSGCNTIAMYERAAGCRLTVPAFRPVREECACYLSCDIGAYDSCGHLCRYCYANRDAARVRSALENHDPASPFLIGKEAPGDVIHDVPQQSWVDRQISVFDVFE